MKFIMACRYDLIVPKEKPKPEFIENKSALSEKKQKINKFGFEFTIWGTIRE